MAEETHTAHHPFPPIAQLFSETWQTFKASALRLLVWQLVGFVAVGIVLAVGGIVAIPFGLLTAFGGNSQAFSLQGASIGALVVDGVFVLVALIVVGASMQAGSILIVAAKGKVSLGEVIRKSLSLSLIVFFTGILVAFLVMGGFFLFVIPAIIVGVLLMFVQYEVVLEGKRFNTAISESVRVVTSNVGEVVARIVLLIGLGLLYSVGLWIVTFTISLPLSLVSGLSNNNNAASMAVLPVQMLLQFASTIVGIVWGWFVLSYVVTFYRHAKAASDPSKKVVTWWMWVVALVGWIVGLIASASLIAVLGTAMKNYKPTPTNNDQYKYNSDYQYDQDTMPEDVVPSVPALPRATQNTY